MIVFLMSLTAAVFAQNSDKKGSSENQKGRTEMRKGQDRPNVMGLNLTDAQKEAFKSGMIEMQKQLLPLKNEMGEAIAHQKTLVSAEKPDWTALNKNIEKIGDLKVEMEKIQLKNRLAMRAQLTDEQKLKFDTMRQMRGQNKKQSGMQRGGSRKG